MRLADGTAIKIGHPNDRGCDCQLRVRGNPNAGVAITSVIIASAGSKRMLSIFQSLRPPYMNLVGEW